MAENVKLNQDCMDAVAEWTCHDVPTLLALRLASGGWRDAVCQVWRTNYRQAARQGPSAVSTLHAELSPSQLVLACITEPNHTLGVRALTEANVGRAVLALLNAFYPRPFWELFPNFELRREAFAAVERWPVVDLSGLAVAQNELPIRCFAGTRFDSLILPTAIHRIQARALAGLRVEHFELPSTIEQLETGAFAFAHFGSIDASRCEKLKTLPAYAVDASRISGHMRLPPALAALRDECFHGLRMPDGDMDLRSLKHLHALPSTAFSKARCRRVLIGAFVQHVGTYAFRDCVVNEVDLSACDKLRVLPLGVFQSSTSERILLPSSISEIESEAFAHLKLAASALTLPNRVHLVASRAFYGCNVQIIDLSRATFTVIYTDTFSMADIKVLLLPATITTLESKCFGGLVCRHLDLSHTAVTIWPNDVFAHTVAAADCLSPTRRAVIGRLTLPGTVTDIHQRGFVGLDASVLDLSRCTRPPSFIVPTMAGGAEITVVQPPGYQRSCCGHDARTYTRLSLLSRLLQFVARCL